MKNNFTTQIMGIFLLSIGRKELSYQCRIEIYKEYNKIIAKAKYIGNHNPLLSAYALGVWFIAMNRKDGLSPEKNCDMLIVNLRSSKLFALVMGDAEHYLDTKRI